VAHEGKKLVDELGTVILLGGYLSKNLLCVGLIVVECPTSEGDTKNNVWVALLESSEVLEGFLFDVGHRTNVVAIRVDISEGIY
jgi:hypothetical protein